MATAKTNPTTVQALTPPAPTLTKAIAQPVAKEQPVKKAAPRKTAATKTAVKSPLPKATAKRKPAVPAKTVKAVKVAKVEKIKKPKLVRDSFTIPKLEYVVLEALKQRATKLTRSVKKSELLRAGIKALAAMSDAAFLSALEKVPAIKTGRPTSAR